MRHKMHKIRAIFGAGFTAALALTITSALTLAANPAHATTLSEALAETLARNPAYKAASQNYQANHASQFVTLATMLPSVTAFAEERKTDSDVSDSDVIAPALDGLEALDRDTDATTYGVELEQTLFSSGKNISAYLAKKADVRREGFALTETEQQILLGATTAYLDVIQAQSVVELRGSNLAVLQQQYQAVKDRFAVGVVTRTDVAQSESGVANARAGLLGAEADLQSARAIYREIIGIEAANLANPSRLPRTPPTLQDALGIARNQSPSLRAAQEAATNARYQFASAVGDALPNLRLTARYSYAETEQTLPNPTNRDNETTTVALRLNVPLFRGGRSISGIRAANYAASAVKSNVRMTANMVDRSVIAAWSNYQATKAQIPARLQQIKSSETALNGVREENKLGTRSVLDVLDAQQNYLDAQVALVQAERDQFVASYGLLANIGHLTGQHLGVEPATISE